MSGIADQTQVAAGPESPFDRSATSESRADREAVGGEAIAAELPAAFEEAERALFARLEAEREDGEEIEGES